MTGGSYFRYSGAMPRPVPTGQSRGFLSAIREALASRSNADPTPTDPTSVGCIASRIRQGTVDFEVARRQFTGGSTVFRDCPVCGGKDWEPSFSMRDRTMEYALMDRAAVGEKEFTELPLVYCFCSMCHYLFINPLPTLRAIDFRHLDDSQKQRMVQAHADASTTRDYVHMEDSAYVVEKRASSVCTMPRRVRRHHVGQLARTPTLP